MPGLNFVQNRYLEDEISKKEVALWRSDFVQKPAVKRRNGEIGGVDWLDQNSSQHRWEPYRFAKSRAGQPGSIPRAYGHYQLVKSSGGGLRGNADYERRRSSPCKVRDILDDELA